MRSVGTRLALWYALVTLATMIGVFTAGRYLLEKYVVHSLDLLNEDEFTQIRLQLGDGYAALTPVQIQERLREITGYGSVLFYVDIHRRTGETLFRSKNLGGHAIPDIPGERTYNTHIEGLKYEIRAGEFLLGPIDVTIATSKEQVLGVMRGYRTVFFGLTAVMLVVSAAIGFGLSWLALRPVRLIQETASHISSENLGTRIPVSVVRDEISDLARLLNRMFDRLESSFNHIRRFTAEASHELKTPLSLIRLQAEKLIVDGGLTPIQEEAVQVQLEEITRLNQIIDELLFLSRAEARAIPLAMRRENPRRFLESFGQDARVLAEDRGVQFVERIEGAGLAAFDPRWIRQVLLNLLSNALNVSPRGGCILLSSELAGGVWRVAIEDEGPGVPPDKREQIFERFVRLESPGKAESRGSGLGLAISRSIIGLHKGKIRAESASGGVGLRVVFEIPAAGDSESPGEKEDGDRCEAAAQAGGQLAERR